MQTLAPDTRTPLRPSNPSENAPSLAPPTMPAMASSLCLDCREKRLRLLQKRLEKWWRRMSLLRRMGMGRDWRWLNSMGVLFGRLQTSLRLTEDQQMVWAEPQDTWSMWTPSDIGIS